MLSHHATGNHPYSQIIHKIQEKNLSDKDLRIVGLTASIVHKKCSLKSFILNLKRLEDKFG